MEQLSLVLDLTGTFVFALSGALAGVKRELDLFGVLVLSFAGGHHPDVLIGAVPPGAVSDWRDLAVSLFAAFYFSSLIMRMSNPVLLFDAEGLALFAVSGASKTLAYGLNPVMAVALGMVTGIGGGPRRIAGRNPNRTAYRTLCGRGACGRCGRGDRAHSTVASRPGGSDEHGDQL